MARGRIADLIEVQGLRADLLLLTSEVVTRAVELGEVARARLTLSVWIGGGSAHVEAVVRRTVSGSEVPRAPVYQDVLMDELADEWSIETEGDTVRIWFTARATPAELDGAWPR